MTILAGIIFFHLLVILRNKMSDEESVNTVSTLFLSILLVAFVVYMMFNMEEPVG